MSTIPYVVYFLFLHINLIEEILFPWTSAVSRMSIPRALTATSVVLDNSHVFTRVGEPTKGLEVFLGKISDKYLTIWTSVAVI